MPITCGYVPAGWPVMAYVRGTITAPVAEDYIATSYAVGRLQPGRDRIVVVEKQARLHQLDIDALRRLQARELAEERARGGPSFHLALVAPSDYHRPLAQLYAALWDLTDVAGVSVSVDTSLPAAVHRIGTSPVPLLSQGVSDTAASGIGRSDSPLR